MFNKYINKIRKALNNAEKMDSMLYNIETSVPQSVSAKLDTIIQTHVEKQVLIASLKKNMLESESIGVSKEQYLDCDVIVSLTSYSKRIYDAYLTIESLMEQSIKPNKIILWLSNNEFQESTLPQSLKKLVNRGLSIEFTEDIKSYKKLIPTLKKYPSDIIITVDDDVLYSYDMIENFVNSYKKNPDIIYFGRGHRMTINDSGQPMSYNDWEQDIQDNNINKLNFPTGVGGILYPPGCFHEDILKTDLFMKLAPSADDVWFKSMAILKGTLSQKVYMPNNYIEIDKTAQKETALYQINVFQNKNDEQIKNVFSKYHIYNLL